MNAGKPDFYRESVALPIISSEQAQIGLALAICDVKLVNSI